MGFSSRNTMGRPVPRLILLQTRSIQSVSRDYILTGDRTNRDNTRRGPRQLNQINVLVPNVVKPLTYQGFALPLQIVSSRYPRPTSPALDGARGQEPFAGHGR